MTTQTNIEHNTKLLIEASTVGNIDEVKRLIPVSDPKANNNEALLGAVYFGHVDIVQMLIPVSDPKTDNSEALRRAAMLGRTEIMKLLIPVSDYQIVLEEFVPVSNHQHIFKQLVSGNISTLQQIVYEYEATQQQQRLNNNLVNIDESKNDHAKRKM